MLTFPAKTANRGNAWPCFNSPSIKKKKTSCVLFSAKVLYFNVLLVIPLFKINLKHSTEVLGAVPVTWPMGETRFTQA